MSTDHLRDWLAAVVALTGLAVAVGALVLSIRSHAWRAAWSSPLVGMERGARRRAMRQLRGRVPVEEADVPVLRQIAERLLAQRWMPGIYAGTSLLNAGLAIRRASVGLLLIWAVIIGTLAAGAFFIFRDAQRARRFLDRHAPDG